MSGPLQQVVTDPESHGREAVDEWRLHAKRTVKDHGHAPVVTGFTMEKNYELKLQSLESIHWWCVGRRDMILRLLKKEDKNSRILDIGCSGGALMESLQQRGFSNVFGIDRSPEATKRCREKGLSRAFEMDGTKTTFDDKYFDVIVSSDTLEHIENDGRAVAEWRRILKPGGKLIVFVPAFNFLWSRHDEITQHYRRYSKRRLTAVFRQNNLQLEKVSYWNFVLFLPISLARLLLKVKVLDAKMGGAQFHETNPAINELLIWLMKLENRYLEGFNFPFGVSLFVAAINGG